jgi:hypothetical protein
MNTLKLYLVSIDHITSKNSIFPWDKEESGEMLRCIDRVRRKMAYLAPMWE